MKYAKYANFGIDNSVVNKKLSWGTTGMVATMKRTEFAGKNMAVLGLARTGIATAEVLKALGSNVILSDNSSATALRDQIEVAARLGVDLRIEASPEDSLRGAEMVVTSPGIPKNAPVHKLALDRNIPIYSEIEVAYRIAKAPILAVTGTNGKTTVAMLLGHILRVAGKKTFVGGNISADEVKLPLITAAMAATSDDVIVGEISSFQLEWVDKFRPKVSILTNITPDHMNRYKDFSEYCATKENMFRAQRPDDVAVISAVNQPAHAIGQRVKSRIYWFDRGNCATCDSACVEEGEVIICWGCEKFRLGRAEDLPMPGTHNLENVLAAAAAAIAFGIDPEAIRDAIMTFQGVVHRMEKVALLNGVTYINNSMCTNVDAAIRSLEALKRPSVLIAGGVDKGSDFRLLGAAIAREARHLILIGRDGSLIGDAARKAGFGAISFASDMDEAVSIAHSFAQSGDAVMLSPACASFDMFLDFEGRGEAFRNAVRNLR